MPPKKPLIHTAAQVRAVSGPTQHRLLAALERLGECSIAELAAAAGLSPESIYYHTRNFERVGIISRAGDRQTDRRTEAIYRLNASHVVFDSANTTPAYRAATAKMIGALLRMAARAYESALDRGAIRRTGKHPNANMHQLFLRIPKSKLAEAQRTIDDCFAHLQSLDDEREQEWTTVTLVCCPLVNPD